MESNTNNPYKNYYQSSNINNNEIIELKNQLNKANKTIEQQKTKISDLQEQLNTYEFIVKDFENSNNQKDTEINNLKSEINKYKSEINNLKSELNKNTPEINNLKLEISKHLTEINNLKSELNNTKISNQANNTNVSLNDLMSVNFISTDQKVHFSVPCVRKNTFAEVEEKLYQQFPEYREMNNTFIANGVPVLRFKTIEENKIGNGWPVTLIIES